MGTSTNGLLFYGYCWPDEDNDFETSMEEVVKAILVGRGMTDPWDAHYVGEQPYENYKAWAATPAGKDEEEAWHAAQRQVESELGVDWGFHCSGERSMPYLHVRGTETTAYRGSPRAITSLEIGPDWKEKLDSFLASQGIEVPEGDNQPGWWLASYWG